MHADEYKRGWFAPAKVELALKNGSYESEDWRKRENDSLFWS